MKPLRIHNSLFISIMLFSLCMCLTFPVFAQKIAPTAEDETIENDDSVTSPLNKAHLELEKAYDSYKQGDIETTKKQLDGAIKWLNIAATSSGTDKAKKESGKLAAEIRSFKNRIKKESTQEESSLARYWHQLTSIIKRETDQLIHSYVKLSIAEKTLNHLLDAKMHLFRANHELFVSHDKDNAEEELSKVVGYLEEALDVAAPAKQSGITSLKKDIQQLKNQVSTKQGSWENDSVILELDKALTSLDKAKQNATPTIQLRIESLKSEFKTLRYDIEKNNIRNDYESAMVKLNKIIVSL